MDKDKLISIFEKYDVEIRLAGSNVKKGQINICCPYCQEDDDFHLGINPVNGFWGCWRSSNHRGTDIYKLLSFLFKIPYKDAKELYRNKISIEDDSLSSLINTLFNTEEKVNKKMEKVINFYPEFKPLLITNVSQRLGFCKYMYNRGFENIQSLHEKYNLQYAITGNYSYRIIFPVYMNSKLITWTGRSIFPVTVLRYMDLSPNESVENIKNCLLNYDRIKYGGDILFISEGPFDAIKLDYYLPANNYGTCLFTKTISDQQIFLLYELSKKFKKLVIILDAQEDVAPYEILDRLSFLPNVFIGKLPRGVEDCGDLTENQVLKIYKENI